MTDIDNMNNWNAQIIAEFRANGGEVASLGVIPIVILHSKGAKSGLERENPLVPLIDGDALYLFASKADGGVHTRRAHDWRTPCIAQPRRLARPLIQPPPRRQSHEHDPNPPRRRPRLLPGPTGPNVAHRAQPSTPPGPVDRSDRGGRPRT